MKTSAKKVFFLVFVVVAGFYAWHGVNAPVNFREEVLSLQTKSQIIEFSVEIAETPRQQYQGYMHRTEIPEGHGMLFIWVKDTPVTMWMKDTPLALDMLFIDAHGKIAYIERNTTPNSEAIIDPGLLVRAVLEIPGGTSDIQGIAGGDRVTARYFTP